MWFTPCRLNIVDDVVLGQNCTWSKLNVAIGVGHSTEDLVYVGKMFYHLPEALYNVG